MAARNKGHRQKARATSKLHDQSAKSSLSGAMLDDIYRRDWQSNLDSVIGSHIDAAVGCLMGWSIMEWTLRVSNVAKTISDKRQVRFSSPVKPSLHSMCPHN